MPHRQVEQCRGVVLSRTARAASTSALGSELCELCSANKGTNGTTGSTACECKDTFVTTSNGECTCSPGYTLENGVCVLCVPGFFKNTTSTDVCKKCNSPLDGVGIEGLVSSLAPATSYLYCTCSPREFRVLKLPAERGFEGLSGRSGLLRRSYHCRVFAAQGGVLAVGARVVQSRRVLHERGVSGD